MASHAARLIALPENPGTRSGYHKVVRSDLEHLEPGPDDFVLVFTEGREPAPPGAVVVPRMSGRLVRRAVNMLRLRPSAEPRLSELRKVLQGRTFDEIFCGDSIFYRPLRKLYPGRPMKVRFHNLFVMARYRQGLRRFKLSWSLRYTMEAFHRLEGEILRDPLVRPIFVTENEQGYYRLAFPGSESDCWTPPGALTAADPGRMKPPACQRLVHFGSLAAHTRVGVGYLIRSVFPQLKCLFPALELHLFGANTRSCHAPDRSIFGHGPFAGEGFPLDGLYVVPDLLGIGIKVKVGDLVRGGVPFIVTPFGTEGYTLPPSEHILVADIDRWPAVIESYMKRQNLAPCPPVRPLGTDSPAEVPALS